MIRSQAAKEIISEIERHSPMLVKEALLISEELNRTAILLKEQCLDCIKEGWESYQNDKGVHKNFVNILTGLHELINKHAESSSEISFHQNFGGELAEAE